MKRAIMKHLFTMKDKVAKKWNQPLTRINAAVAIRDIAQGITQDPLINENRSDFALYTNGTFCEDTGRLIPIEGDDPQLVLELSNLPTNDEE